MGGLGISNNDESDARIVGCRSDYELFVSDEGDGGRIVVNGAGGGVLKASRTLDTARKGELIKSVRGGEHVELHVRARTFRQKDGSPNKNYLRLNPAKLDTIAASFAGKPMLLD